MASPHFWAEPACGCDDRRIELASIIGVSLEDVAEGWSLCTKSGPQRIPLYILPDARHVLVKRKMLRKCFDINVPQQMHGRSANDIR